MTINCPSCDTALHLEQLNETSSCSRCMAVLHSSAFPALTKAGDGGAAQQIDAQGQAGCFYHPAKQASVSCAHCGRFLCALCDLELSGQHICSTCLSSGKDQLGVTALNKGSQRFDMIALALALWPMILFTPLCVITAPLAIYCSIKYYKKPLSSVPVGRWRFYVASLLALFQLTGIALLSYYLLR